MTSKESYLSIKNKSICSKKFFEEPLREPATIRFIKEALIAKIKCNYRLKQKNVIWKIKLKHKPTKKQKYLILF